MSNQSGVYEVDLFALLAESNANFLKIILLIALVYVLMMSEMARLFDDDIAYFFSLCFDDV